MTPSPSFSPRPFTLWRGRYGRVPGDATAFHVWDDAGAPRSAVQWTNGDERWWCSMADCAAAQRLAAAVREAKLKLGGVRGNGSFLINEFGQVLVPSYTGRERAWVGDWAGPLLFEDPSRHIFELYEDRGLSPGDEWERPYVGNQYNISRFGEIYFWNDEEGEKDLPERQDEQLVQTVRSIRPRGAVRLIVGCGGIVLTRCPKRDGDWIREAAWTPRYVGRINLASWFSREE